MSGSFLSGRSALVAALPLACGCVIIGQAEYDERLAELETGQPDDSGCDAPSVWYADEDGDGAGDRESPVESCAQPEGTVDNASDCDDSDAAVQTEQVWYLDEDGDGYGLAGSGSASCDPVSGHVLNGEDCDDTNGAVSPAALEDCATDIDEDCDGTLESGGSLDAVGCVTYYADSDLDGYGDASACLCESTDEFTVTSGGDCDDTDDEVSPAATEVCGDGIDNDCDGGPAGCTWSGELDGSDVDRTLIGGEEWDDAGHALHAGDLTGDGTADLVIGAPTAISEDGVVAVWAWDESESLDESDRLLEGYSGRWAGWAVHVADLDGDGADDLATSAHYDDGGYAWLVAGPVTAMRLSAADQIIEGSGSDKLGYALGSVRDWSGDFANELLIGVRDADDGSDHQAGYVAVFEQALSSSEPRAEIWGEDDDQYVGFSVHGGDISGDGIDDVGFGAYGDQTVRVVEGPVSGELSYDDADWAIRSDDSSKDEGLGAVVFISDDLSGDGCAELIGASRYADRYGTDAGLVAVMSACATGWQDVPDSVVQVVGTADMGVGQAVHTADIDADGVPDLLVGVREYDNRGHGAVAVYYGPVSGMLLPDDADFLLVGEDRNDRIGRSIAVADVNGDGLLDLAVGAPDLDGDADNVGGALLLLGEGL